MLLHVLQLHATVHGYAGDVQVLQPNGMIAPGLPCGRAGRNHDNITLYSCDRPSPYCSRARICPGTGVNRLTFAPGQKSLSRYAISGHFREPGQDNPQSPHTPTNRIGGIQPIPKSTYCPGSHVERLTCKPGQRELSRYAKNTRFTNQDSDFCPGTHIKRLMHEPGQNRIAAPRQTHLTADNR